MHGIGNTKAICPCGENVEKSAAVNGYTMMALKALLDGRLPSSGTLLKQILEEFGVVYQSFKEQSVNAQKDVNEGN